MKNKILAIITSAFALFGCIAPVPVFADYTNDTIASRDDVKKALSSFSCPERDYLIIYTNEHIRAFSYDSGTVYYTYFDAWDGGGNIRGCFDVYDREPLTGTLKQWDFKNGSWSLTTDYTSDESTKFRLDTFNDVWFTILSGGQDFLPVRIGSRYDVWVIASTKDLKGKNGPLADHVLFRGPLSLPQVVEEEQVKGAQVLTSQMAGNLKTLVLCGVGCLALLMALAALYRVLRQFLGK